MSKQAVSQHSIKTLAKNILLLALSLLLAVVLLEAVMRVLGIRPDNYSVFNKSWAMPHPRLGWMNRPGSFVSNEEGHATMTFQPGGKRTSMPPQDGTAMKDLAYKVAFVGCSYTQGYGVKDEDTFVSGLSRKYPAILFDNYGTGGYGTVQSLLMMEQLLANSKSDSRYDSIIYSFIPTHEDRNVASTAGVLALTDSMGRHVFAPHVSMEKDSLAIHPYQAVQAWPLERHSLTVALLHKTWLQWTLRGRGEQKRRVTGWLLEEMNRLAGTHQAGFLVVLLQDDPAISGFLKEKGIPFINCAHPSFGKDPSLALGAKGHPSPLLHTYWAGCIAQQLDDYLAKKRINKGEGNPFNKQLNEK